jgi:hypothetical protein
MTARSSPSVARNREPILEVLRQHLKPDAHVLELASGTGEHALFMSTHLPQVSWRPTDPDEMARESIAAWREREGSPNLLAPLAADAAAPATWPAEAIDAIVCINMIHISPWAATEGLMRGAAERLPRDGLLYLYGPYLEAETPTAASNLAFDADLRRRNPEWGLRDRAAVERLASVHGLDRVARVSMPANNLSLVFVRR